MAGFLKKAWGAPSNAGTGNGPQQGGTGKDAVPPVEWHSEAPGERYFGFENVRFSPLLPPLIRTGPVPDRTTFALDRSVVASPAY